MSLRFKIKKVTFANTLCRPTDLKRKTFILFRLFRCARITTSIPCCPIKLILRWIRIGNQALLHLNTGDNILGIYLIFLSYVKNNLCSAFLNVIYFGSIGTKCAALVEKLLDS